MDLLRRRWLVAVTAGSVALFTLSAWSDGDFPTEWWYLDIALILLNTLPLMWLGRNPLLVVLVFAVAYPLWLDPIAIPVFREGHVLQSVPTLVALYATGVWDRPLWIRTIALVTPAWMMTAAVIGYWDADASDLSFVALVFVIAWALGVVAAGRQKYVDELEAKTKELEAARHALAEQAVTQERSRIARELHDVVAHAMSVITVQAGVGGHLMATRPQRAAEALGIIERTGRDALAELRRMLVVLRPGTDSQATSPPQPGVADLPGLIETTQSAGVRVDTQLEGSARPLPPGLDLAVYRVIQESLTNVAKHAAGATATVCLRFESDRLVVEVRDDGSESPRQVDRGQGLLGMAERVDLYDGRLVTESGPDGFRVVAVFPLESLEREPA